MLIELRALAQELPALQGRSTTELCELLASLGFPVDGVEAVGDSTVLEVDITANRGDAQSHRGMARDLAAKLGAPLSLLPHQTLGEGGALLPIRLEAEACPFYATAILDLARSAGTPEAVRSFLGHLGSSAKGLGPVDASNELLHRYGHPTHAFDADRVKGALIVRWAKPGECLVTLDGLERKLTELDLVIADETGPIALAGVMGGDSTKVSEGTTRVLLESAYFDPRTVRRMAHRHGLHTDASHRFGRGADPAMATVARDLLAQRLIEWCGATLQSAWSAGRIPPARAEIVLEGARLNRIAGESLDLEEAATLLRRLGASVRLLGSASLGVVPPTWRHDLNIPEDLAEEVLRLRGYDVIPMALPPLQGHPEPLDAGYLQRRALGRRLAQLGFFQTVTFGFVGPDMDGLVAGEDNPVEGRTLANPLGQDYSVMRSSLLPSLAEALRENAAQGAHEVRLFEIAPVYRSTPSGPAEHFVLALVWAGTLGGEDPLSPATSLAKEGQARLKGILRDLGAPADVAVQPLKVGKAAGLSAELLAQAWCAELPLSALPEPERRLIPAFKPFSRYPAVERDLSLLVGLDLPYRVLEAALRGALPVELTQDLRCVDVFRHKSLPQGRQAWLLRFRFQALDRTLTSEEVEGWMASALAAAQSLGAELRG